MKIVLLRSRGVKPETQRDEKQCDKVKSAKETTSNSTTSDTIGPEVWIMSGLLLSVVMQIVSVSHLPKLEDLPDDE